MFKHCLYIKNVLEENDINLQIMFWNSNFHTIHEKYTNNGFMKFNCVINILKDIIFSNEVKVKTLIE